MKLTFKLDAKAGSAEVHHELCVEFDEGTQKIHAPLQPEYGLDQDSTPDKLTGDETVFLTEGVDMSYVCEGLVMKVVKRFYESAHNAGHMYDVETESNTSNTPEECVDDRASLHRPYQMSDADRRVCMHRLGNTISNTDFLLSTFCPDCRKQLTSDETMTVLRRTLRTNWPITDEWEEADRKGEL